jgi:hypothetical protein
VSSRIAYKVSLFPLNDVMYEEREKQLREGTTCPNLRISGTRLLVYLFACENLGNKEAGKQGVALPLFEGVPLPVPVPPIPTAVRSPHWTIGTESDFRPYTS